MVPVSTPEPSVGPDAPGQIPSERLREEYETLVEQVRSAAAVVRSGGLGANLSRLSNVVFMGMGEPLANYRRVVDAVHRLCDTPPAGLGLLGARRTDVHPVADQTAEQGLGDLGRRRVVADEQHGRHPGHAHPTPDPADQGVRRS